MLRLLIVALVMIVVGSTSTPARGQTYELSGGWALPVGGLSDISKGGPSLRFTYVRTVSWFNKGQVIGMTGYTHHLGKDFGILEEVEELGVLENRWSVQDIPLMVGVRFKKPASKGHLDLTAGLLHKRISIDFGTGSNRIGGGTSSDTDPAIAAYGGYALSEKMSAWGALLLATDNWRRISLGLTWVFTTE